jgi:5-methyltetrahydropteroyltriglutamate--homocysteine methyltransferase
MNGLRPLAPSQCLGVPGRTAWPRYQIVAETAAPQGLGIVEEFRYLASIAGPEVQVTLPGPLTLAELIAPGGRYRAPMVVAENLALIVRQELLRLAEAGCRHIRLDEPALASSQAPPGDLVRTVNAAIHGIRSITVGIHFEGYLPAQRSYYRIFPMILELEAEEVALEFAARELCEANLWLEFSPGKRLCAGVIDARHPYVETPAEVAGRIRSLVRYVPEDRLTLAPDCGLAELPRQAAFGKLCSLVAGARMVRQEITGLAHAG